MKFLLAYALFLALVGLLDASTPQNANTAIETLTGYLLGAGLIDEREKPLVRRQRQEDVCSSNPDCWPPGVSAVPSSLIECVIPGGLCSCNDCFERSSNGTCVEVECEDWRYDQQELACQDNRPRQLTAFLLSLFLSATGAANFYIGRDDLAGGQLFLFLFIFAVSYALCCIPCCLTCCMDKEDVKGSIIFILVMVLVLILVVLDGLALWAWWLADLIIFATNQRDAGNGCMLTENL